MVSFPEAIKLSYKRYADFQGRSSRSEYWWYILWIFALLALVLIPTYPWFYDILMAEVNGEISPDPSLIAWVGISLAIVVTITHIIPGIAIAVRRWHDLGQTGWLWLVFSVLSNIPIIGWVADIINLVWFCLKGNDGENKYGPDPLGAGIKAVFD